MLATLIPIFDNETSVCAYAVSAQKADIFKNPLLGSTASLDGITNVAGFEVVNSIGVAGILGNKDVYVPVNSFAIYTDIREQCNIPYKSVVLVFDKSLEPTDQNIERISELKSQGFKIAVKNIPTSSFAAYQKIFKLTDDFFLDYKEVSMTSAIKFFGQYFPNVRICAENINSKEDFDELSKEGESNLYEGSFFRMPVTESQTQLTPMKVTYIELLNIINGVDFELTKVAKVVERDPALVVSLLEIVNHMSRNSEITSVKHAAAMLGQIELKKWINTAVTKELCSDKPSEIMRISMMRAKFAENLARKFELEMQAQELFLMGLFSVLDIMLSKPMEEALELVKVSKNVQNALLNNDGPFAPVLSFIKEYEDANWTEVSRRLIVDGLKEKEVYALYLETLEWYRDIFPEK